MVCTIEASKFWALGNKQSFIKRRVAGIYAIRNLQNQKVYVGSAVSISERLYNHVWHLECGTHHNPKLLNAWRKYSLSAFSLEILEVVEKSDFLLVREQFWIDKLDALATGYNLSPNAGSNLGRVFGRSARQATAKATRRVMADPIVKARHKAATIAGMRNPEIKQKCSEHLKQRWRDPAARALLMTSRHNPETTRKAALKQSEVRLRMSSEVKRKCSVKGAARRYRVIYPSGHSESIINLKQFCLEQALSYHSAMNVICGRMRCVKGYVFERLEAQA